MLVLSIKIFSLQGWNSVYCNHIVTICDSTHRNNHLVQKIKIDFCYFLNGCSFSSILVQKVLKLDIAFWKYGNFKFIEDIITHKWKLILRKRFLKFGNQYKILVFWQFQGPFLHEHIVFAQNPSNNLKIKHWRF